MFTQMKTYSHRRKHMVLLPEYQQCYQAEVDALLWWTCTRKLQSKPSEGKAILIVVFTIRGLFMLCSRTQTSPSLHVTSVELRASHHQVIVFWHVLSCTQGARSSYTTDNQYCLVYTAVHKLWWVEISFYCVDFTCWGL